MHDQKKLELVTALTTAMSNCSLYSSEHPIVISLSEKARGIIEDLMGENDAHEIMIIDNELVFDGEPLKEKSIHIHNFAKRLRRKGVDKIIFKRGLETVEVLKLISDIAEPKGVLGRYTHISTGIVEVLLGDALSEGISRDELEKFKDEQIDNIKDVFRGISRFKKLDIAGLEDIVINFITVFKKEANILNIMVPFKSYTEYTYTHASNVAILTLFQAETLGIKGDLLHDIGIAALLHDTGKMYVPNEILEKKGKLNDDEWKIMQRHTLYGAKYLMTKDGVPKISIPAALEHHLKYDGTGYPRMRHLNARQHLSSQLVAIADVFDALRSRRPYKKDFEVVEILSILRQDAGSAFNPMLVDNFIKNLGAKISL